MGDVLRAITGIALAIEIGVAIVMVVLNATEVRFLERRVRPRLEQHEELPLFNVLTSRARAITAIGVYFLVLTGLGAADVNLGQLFPPLRALNGALLLYLISGPRIYGEALRRRVRSES